MESGILSPSDLGTLSGAVTIVYFTTQVLRYVFDVSSKVIGLVISLITSYSSLIVSNDYSLASLVIALPNSFIIYASAVGISRIASQKLPINSESDPIEEGEPRKNFFSSWY